MTIDLTKLLTFILAPIILVILIGYEAFFVWYLWAWFVVPFGIQQLGVWHIAGLLLISGFFKRTIKKNDKTDWLDMTKWLIAPWFILLVGYIIRFYIM